MNWTQFSEKVDKLIELEFNRKFDDSILMSIHRIKLEEFEEKSTVQDTFEDIKQLIQECIQEEIL